MRRMLFRYGADPHGDRANSHQLRVSTKSAYQWRRRWRAGGTTALASRGAGGAVCRLSPAQLARLRAESSATAITAVSGRVHSRYGRRLRRERVPGAAEVLEVQVMQADGLDGSGRNAAVEVAVRSGSPAGDGPARQVQADDLHSNGPAGRRGSPVRHPANKVRSIEVAAAASRSGR